ncbi:MAG: hypothetical protein ACD_75C00422G0001, partial [uncultured bacterium]
MVNRFDDVLRFDNGIVFLVSQWVLFRPVCDGCQPGLVPAGLFNKVYRLRRKPFIDSLQSVFAVGDDGDVDADILTDRGRVDIDMDDFRLFGKFGQLARHPVIEAGADRDQQIGFGD